METFQWSFFILVSFSSQASNVNTSFRTERDRCDTPAEGKFYSARLSEITPIGTVVHTIPTLGSNISDNFFIDGNTNKNERFHVSDNGTVYLSGYLDYDIDQTYTLSVLSYDGNNTIGNGVCVRHTLEVTVLDDSDWPRHFNDSCCACPKAKPRPKDYPFFFEIVIGEDNLPYDNTGVGLWKGRIYIDSTDDCRISIYLMVDGTQLQEIAQLVQGDIPRIPVAFSCAHRGRGYQSYGGHLRFHESINSTTKRLQREHWFQARRNDQFFQLDFADEIYRDGLGEPSFSCRGKMPNSNYEYKIAGRISIIGCPEGYYGTECTETCICKNGAICHTLRGSCKCHPGWQGPACDIRRSEVRVSSSHVEVYNGDDIVLRAMTYNILLKNSTVTWFRNGSNSFLKDSKHFNINVDTSLNISRLDISQVQDWFEGTYVCSVTDSSGNQFTATTTLSTKGCHENYYGENCDLPCACDNDAICDRHRGCICRAGWMGTYCNEGCLPGWYGNDCASQCICENNSTCDTKDGTCTCNEATCGKYCDSKCECYEEQHFVCEETTGLCRCEGSRFRADSTGYSFDIFLFAVIGIASAAIALFACLVCLAHGLRRHRQGFKTIVDTEFDSYVEELLSEHPDLDDWILKRKDIKVQKEIGFGEFGRIELAELQRRDGTVTVALKSLMTKLRHCLPISYRDFCHEIACLKKLQGHPHIIYLLGIVVSGDPKYIIVEYAARGDLLNYVRELRNKGITRPEEERLLGMARDITLALQHMEENKFIHRDIACRNVLIMEDYVAKIGDFGLSRDIYETGQYCKDLWSPIHGPLPLKWTPPEFLQGGVYDTKGDIWSYGVLLWEMATLGETPFTNVPTSEMTKFFLDGQRLYQPERCTNSLYNIMLRCWQLKPIARPNARELTNELEELSRLDERFFNDIVPEQFEIEDW